MNSNPTSEILDLLTGFMKSACISAAVNLNIVDHLNKRPMTIDQLTAVTKTNKDSLQRLINALINLNILEDIDGSHYCPTALGESLGSDHPFSLQSIAKVFGVIGYKSWSELRYSIDTGKPGFSKAFGVSLNDYLESNQDMKQHYAKATNSLASISVSSIDYDFSQFKTIIEIGPGDYLVEVLKHTGKQLKGIVYSDNTDLANLLIEENQLSECCEAKLGNYESIPVDFDLYLLKMILLESADEKLLQILENIRKSMKQSSKILIVIFNGDTFSSPILDLHFLVTFGGRDRTIEQFKEIIAKAGLTINEIYNYPLEHYIEVVRA